MLKARLPQNRITTPAPRLEEADYSHFEKFRSFDEKGEAIDLSLLLKDLRFSSEIEFGLEWVDILTNAIRRALIGNLRIEGWGGIAQTMIYRKEHYIAFVRLDGVSTAPQNPPYISVVRHFWKGGKSMITKHNLQQA